MTSTKVPPFSGAMNENGYEWLKDIESFFMEAQWNDNTRRCEYFRLRFRGDADRRFNSFDDATQQMWALLRAQWIKAYPSPIPEETTSETTELNLFKALRLEISKITEPYQTRTDHSHGRQ
ncbi:hypothetical protein M422DRAFT_251583 [Sphaerobolus stellatus SS14]|uniref:Uncharacterized protein n=1 Tax=Sphaerobolus stellatus (strain SS14) TaxID=990650 RepID=A0A0C9VD89_SPHS4|nr:hypothetical protein M422DRAFT_251583 [Sphaerobolus stellatus SS14]